MKKFALKARNRIKVVLVLKGFQNKDLANYLDADENTVSKWCVNTKQPSLHTLAAIADYLDVDIRELLESTKKSGGSSVES